MLAKFRCVCLPACMYVYIIENVGQIQGKKVTELCLGGEPLISKSSLMWKIFNKSGFLKGLLARWLYLVKMDWESKWKLQSLSSMVHPKRKQCIFLSFAYITSEEITKSNWNHNNNGNFLRNKTVLIIFKKFRYAGTYPIL